MFDPKQPLWLPRGSGRLIMAWAFVAGFIVAVFTLPIEQTAILGGMTGIVVKDYFSNRQNSK